MIVKLIKFSSILAISLSTASAYAQHESGTKGITVVRLGQLNSCLQNTISQTLTSEERTYIRNRLLIPIFVDKQTAEEFSMNATGDMSRADEFLPPSTLQAAENAAQFIRTQGLQSEICQSAVEGI